jgi:hypothetical protein
VDGVLKIETGKGSFVNLLLPGRVDAVEDVGESGAGDLEKEALDLVRRSLFVDMLGLGVAGRREL